MNIAIEQTRDFLRSLGFKHYSESLPIEHGEDIFMGHGYVLEISYTLSIEEDSPNVGCWSISKKGESRALYSSSQKASYSDLFELQMAISDCLKSNLGIGKVMPKQRVIKLEKRIACQSVETNGILQRIENRDRLELSTLEEIAEELGNLEDNLFVLHAIDYFAFLESAKTLIEKPQYEELYKKMRKLAGSRYCFVSAYLNENGDVIISPDYSGALIQEITAAQG